MNTSMLYVTILTQNQNDSINAVLLYGRVDQKDCCVVFSAFLSIFDPVSQTVQRQSSYYLLIKNKNN